MKTNIFIPSKINVGFQNRNDTYTGKLAYVIYYDEKGKLRKETSWNSWRDKNIPNEEFENVPTSGFVLNRRAGGVEESWGWNARKTYCRIYDPRNFEFEITIENLLYILENANSIKGKGLEGEFVYGWDGKDLVLMPVESPDYKEISEYNNILHNKETVKAKDLKIGATYLTKNNQEQIYVGKFEHYDYYGNNEGKQFWFVYKYYNYDWVGGQKVYRKDYEWSFAVYKSISGKFIKCIDESCTNEYSVIFDKLEHCEYYCPYDKSKDKYISYSFEEFEKLITEKKKSFLSSKNTVNGAFLYDVLKEDDELYKVQMNYRWNSTGSPEYKDYINRFRFDIKKVNYYWCIKDEYEFIPTTLEEIYQRLHPCYRIEYLSNGNERKRVCYYGTEK
jgi:hypothetical protein